MLSAAGSGLVSLSAEAVSGTDKLGEDESSLLSLRRQRAEAPRRGG